MAVKQIATSNTSNSTIAKSIDSITGGDFAGKSTNNFKPYDKDFVGPISGNGDNDSNLPQWAKDRIAKYTDQYNSTGDNAGMDQANENIQAMRRLAGGGYSDDRISTVLYAVDHADDTSNNDGYHYIHNNEGSDCANFVSQCLNQAFNMSDDWYFFQ